METPVRQQCMGQPRTVCTARMGQPRTLHTALPFLFPVSFLVKEFLRYGESLSQRSKWNRTFRYSASSDLQIGFIRLQFCISAPRSLVPPHFSQALHGSAHLFFCASALSSSDQSLLFVSSGPAVHSHLHTDHLATARLALRTLATLVFSVTCWLGQFTLDLAELCLLSTCSLCQIHTGTH